MLQRFVRFVEARSQQNLIDIYTEYIEYLGGCVAQSTFCRNMGAVKQFLCWLREMEIINRLPQTFVRTPVARIVPRRRKVITPEKYIELKTFIRNSKSSLKGCLNDLFTTGWWTGMGVEDSCMIHWGMIDMDEMIIHAPRVKTGVGSYIPIIAGSEFHQYLLYRREDDPLDPGWPNSPESNIYYVNPFLAAWCISSKQKTGQPAGLRSKVSDVFINSGNKGMGFHDFRRSLATLLGNDPQVSASMVMKIMGWKSADMINHYVQPDMTGLQEAFRRAIAKRHEKHETKEKGGRRHWELQVPKLHQIEYPEDQKDIGPGDADTGVG